MTQPVRDERERAICQVSALLHEHPAETFTWDESDRLAAEIVSYLQGDGWTYPEAIEARRVTVCPDHGCRTEE